MAPKTTRIYHGGSSPKKRGWVGPSAISADWCVVEWLQRCPAVAGVPPNSALRFQSQVLSIFTNGSPRFVVDGGAGAISSLMARHDFAQYIGHYGDANTFFSFTPDALVGQVGGVDWLDVASGVELNLNHDVVGVLQIGAADVIRWVGTAFVAQSGVDIECVTGDFILDSAAGATLQWSAFGAFIGHTNVAGRLRYVTDTSAGYHEFSTDDGDDLICIHDENGTTWYDGVVGTPVRRTTTKGEDQTYLFNENGSALARGDLCIISGCNDFAAELSAANDEFVSVVAAESIDDQAWGWFTFAGRAEVLWKNATAQTQGQRVYQSDTAGRAADSGVASASVADINKTIGRTLESPGSGTDVLVWILLKR